MLEKPAFQRARSPEHKRARHDAILSAARALGLRDGVRNVSLGDIALEVGLAKSNVLRYFETREAIYLQLEAEGWRDWGSAARVGIARAGGAGEVAEALARTLAERPLFCDLLTHSAASLEHNASADAVRVVTLASFSAIDEVAAEVARRIPSLGDAGARELVTATCAAAAALWPMANPPFGLAALYAEDPALARAAIEFAPALQRLVEVLIAGIPAAGAGSSLTFAPGRSPA